MKKIDYSKLDAAILARVKSGHALSSPVPFRTLCDAFAVRDAAAPLADKHNANHHAARHKTVDDIVEARVQYLRRHGQVKNVPGKGWVLA